MNTTKVRGDTRILVAVARPEHTSYTLFDQELNVEAHFTNFDELPSVAAHIDIGILMQIPGEEYMHDQRITDQTLANLQAQRLVAPRSFDTLIDEVKKIKSRFPKSNIYGISDSAFHRHKPNYSWNYGIGISEADKLDIKRYGYHGVACEEVVRSLWDNGKLAPRVVHCHLDDESSVSAIFHSRSIDSTTAFVSYEGIMPLTHSGDIGYHASRALQSRLNLDEIGFDKYLLQSGGIQGLGGSGLIDDLITREKDGDHLAHLALATYVHNIHKSIGAMVVAMNGADLIVFSGLIGEKNHILRKRIISHLAFADFHIDGAANEECSDPQALTLISQKGASRPIIVVPTSIPHSVATHVRQLSPSRE